jgi:hypothetical protein
MDCRDVTTQLADYLAGTLSDGELDLVRTHLAGCAGCRAEVDGLDETWQALGTIVEAPPDSAAMRGRFDAVLQGYEQALGESERRARVGGTRWSLWRVRKDPPYATERKDAACATRRLRIAWLQAAAAAALLAGGVAIGRQSAPAATPPTAGGDQITALRRELGEMRLMMTLSLLQQQSASERLRGVTFTSQIPQPGSDVVAMALLDTLMHDQNVNVRLASIDALKRFAHNDVVRRGAMDALPRQTSPLVQLALIDFVLETAGAESVGSLRALSREGMLDEAVRTRLTRSLQQLGAAL